MILESVVWQRGDICMVAKNKRLLAWTLAETINLLPGASHLRMREKTLGSSLWMDDVKKLIHVVVYEIISSFHAGVDGYVWRNVVCRYGTPNACMHACLTRINALLLGYTITIGFLWIYRLLHNIKSLDLSSYRENTFRLKKKEGYFTETHGTAPFQLTRGRGG